MGTAIAIGADMVIYQPVSDLEAACTELSPQGIEPCFESSIFSSCYVTGVPKGNFEHFEQIRGGTKQPKVLEAARRTTGNTPRDEDLSQAVAYEELRSAHSLITLYDQGFI